jgi:hypothetical protein
MFLERSFTPGHCPSCVTSLIRVDLKNMEYMYLDCITKNHKSFYLSLCYSYHQLQQALYVTDVILLGPIPSGKTDTEGKIY